MELLLDQSEVNVDNRQLSSHKIALSFEVVIWNLECFFQEIVDILMLIGVTLYLAKDLVANGASDWLYL